MVKKSSLGGNRTIELVDMVEHGFPYGYSFRNALAVLRKLRLGRPVYDDVDLLKHHPEKYWDRLIMFPHKPVSDADDSSFVVYRRAGDSSNHRRIVDWVDNDFSSCVLIVGIRKSPA